ncbi:MAG: (deoxy)nucleoside triphosphate pyrophosphohydrolase [Candidatus Loosdrechtia sp.]|uniref:(deoxy)nucleoside triphosphate pyrophosphohydrolase n=1 Tax=Candidatus Loosdrechtia sp. TaxID=3101272 RepID=UPI003A775596|nr:MAG: (deoxy)nucleoside triphosphate pyrophosphohydrolase [Candidatus Jettenia sp. AMX2]
MVSVACAIIENRGKVLAARRSESMSLPLKWEFPGGKIKKGESPEECLKRELLEELGIEVTVIQSLPPVTHHYPEFAVMLYPFICKIVAGEITLREHVAVTWLQPDELHTLDWAEADRPVIDGYREALQTRTRNVS